MQVLQLIFLVKWVLQKCSQLHHQFKHITHQQHYLQRPAPPHTTAAADPHTIPHHIQKIDKDQLCKPWWWCVDCPPPCLTLSHTKQKMPRIWPKQMLVLFTCMLSNNISSPQGWILDTSLCRMAGQMNLTFRVLSVRHGQTVCHSSVSKFCF